ncbi:AfsR/SARP family transcriptional regulator [Paractinoplanes globisporus]|uniref:BTAD domain-containing putative transcriptional regulator n=1 Tax=Paractinoplanes globisporus TaxID=113565 RepID=A0ABW6WLA1_9ACTN|nr:BTAD domain-containing putative transcriptional regulator [Actinoplanes globisporus]
MRWRLLGPVRLTTDSGEIDPGRGKQSCVLASLLLTPGRRVSVEALTERLWEGSPPRSATAVAPYVTRLRRVLEPVPGAGELHHVAGGYLLDIDPDLIDLHLVRKQVRLAADTGSVDLFAGALDGWQPEALAGVPGAWAAGVRDVIARERLDAFAQYGRLLAGLGRREQAIAVLDPLVAEHPTAEPLVAVLMSALAETGQSAAALRHYARAHDAIAEQLGGRPSPELLALNAKILRGGPAARHVPAQLPAAPADFTGRRSETERLDGVREMVVISGPPGVGKSALAIHWGHRTRQRFPDGQLYLNLRGFDPEGAMTPDDAARDLLVALIPAERIPVGLAARSALLRSELAERRMLLLLDNARDAAQVRPLLPGGAGCTVVVTSRNRIPGLVAANGAVPLALAPLRPDEAEALLARRLGAIRVAHDADSVRVLVTATAGLPLALATVAARAATRHSLAVVADELSRSRLDGLRGLDAGADPRTVFSWSYHALTPPAARLFRLLGAHLGPDISAAAVDSLAGENAVATLDELTAASLLTEHRPNRYALHDLLREYAASLVEPGERDAARQRLLDHYLHTGRAGAMLLDPQRQPLDLKPAGADVFPESLADEQETLAWFAAEHANLMAVLRHPAEPAEYGWQIPWTMVDHLDRRGYWDDWIIAERCAVEAARRCDEPLAEALAERLLARAYVQTGRFAEAEPHYAAAIELYATVGDLTGRANTLFAMAWMWEQRDRYQDCVREISAALELYRLVENEHGVARALNALGWFEAHLGEYDDAIEHCQAALALATRLEDRYGQAATWDSIGWIHHRRGEFGPAIAALDRALTLHRQTGDLFQQADILDHLGDAHAAEGRDADAVDAWREAVAILERLDHPNALRIRAKISP